MADDYSSTTSTTGTISVGGSATGNIETINDTDWFKTTLTAGRTYRFDLQGSATGQGTLVDPYLSVRDATGNTKLAESDNGGVGLNSQFTYTPTTTGTFFVAAGAGFNPNGTGTYTVSLADVTPSADDYSSTTSTTGTISVGGSATGNIETINDTDWFKTTLTAGRTYRFDLQGSATGQGTLVDPYLSVRDATGNTKLAESDNGGVGLNSQFTYTPTTTGTFFVATGAGFNPNGTGTYTVSLADVTPSADDYSSTTSTTGTISVGGSATGNIETINDTDWFKTTLTAGRTYRFDLQGSATGQGTLVDPYLSVRDATGNTKLAESDNGGVGLNSQFTYTPTTTGTFFVAAGAGFNPNGTGTYTVSLADVTPSADDYSSTTSTTGTISVGGSATGNIETINDTDWFKTTLTAGRTYRFDLQGSATGQGTLVDPYLSVRDATGNTKLAESDNGGVGLNSQFTYTPTTTGTFFVAAGAGFNPNGTGTYTVSLADVTPSADDYSSTTSTTGTISVGGSATGNIETINDTDWFKTTLTAGRTYRFDLQGSATGQGTLVDPYLSVRDATGNTKLAESDNGGVGLNSQFTYTPTTTGTFFVAAGAGFNPNGTGTYTLSLADVTPTNADVVPDTPATTSTYLTLDLAKPGKIDATGQDGLAGDNDVYKVTLAAGHSYTFSANANVSTSDALDQVFIRLYNNNGLQLSPDLTAGSSATPQFTTPVLASTGDYFFAISADGAANTWKVKTGDYSVLVHDNGASSSPSSTPDVLLAYTDAEPGSANSNDVVQAALSYVGARWHTDNCTGLLWAISESIGAPFFDDTVAAPAIGQPVADLGYIVPHKIGVKLGPDVGWDQWTTVAITSNWTSVVQPGDFVRVYYSADPSNTDERTLEAHSFVVVGKDANNDWLVVDNTVNPGNPAESNDTGELITITKHSFNPSSPTFGSLVLHPQIAYVSRLTAPLTPTAGDVLDNVNTQGVLSSTVSGKIDTEPMNGSNTLLDGQGGLVDKDWYKVTLEKGNIYTFTGTQVSITTGLMDINLYSQNGTAVVSHAVEGANPALTFDTTYQTSPTQTYFLAVSAGGADPAWKTATGAYSVSLSAQVSTTADQTPGSIASRTPIPSNHLGAIDAQDVNGGVDDDYYSLALNGGEKYKIIATAGVSDADTLDSVFIQLRDSSGGVIASVATSASGPNPTFEYAVPGTGQQSYFLEISASSTGAAVDFRLVKKRVNTPLLSPMKGPRRALRRLWSRLAPGAHWRDSTPAISLGAKLTLKWLLSRKISAPLLAPTLIIHMLL